MNHCSGDEHLLELDDGRMWLILRDLGVRPDRVVAVGVTVYRDDPLDSEDLHAKSSSTPGDGSDSLQVDDLPF